MFQFHPVTRNSVEKRPVPKKYSIIQNLVSTNNLNLIKALKFAASLEPTEIPDLPYKQKY